MPHAPQRYSMVSSDSASDRASFGEEVAQGLTAQPKTLPCRFFYDAEGSELFEQICDLPEYYLTRCEREILEQRADAIAAHFPGPITLAELGSGSSAKTRLLIEALLRRHGRLRYVPVDVSRTMLEASARDLLDSYGALEIRAIASEYAEGLRHVRAATDRAKLVSWLGSSVGNFDRSEAAHFLGEVREALGPADRVLLGIDLRKDGATLERAYDDAQGVTARFNLNLLGRINRELGGSFEPAAFEHRAVYDEIDGRVEMHLVSRREQRVRIADIDLEVKFQRGESIHTENSYKYDAREIEALAAVADLAVVRRWLDAGGRFSVSLLAPI